MYTYVALLAVSGLLVLSFAAYVESIRFASETKQLRDLMDGVAARTTEIITISSITDGAAETCVQLPMSIGSKQYWLQFHSDPLKTWLEGGFGNVPFENSELRVYLPKRTIATGSFRSGYDAARVRCDSPDGRVLRIEISTINGVS